MISAKCTCFIASFMILVVLGVDSFSQTAPVVIKGIEYRFDDGKWYNYLDGKRADEIIPQRLVVRLANRGLFENFDFETLDIQGISLVSPRYLDGFYVLALPETADPFDIAKRLEATGLFENIHFDALGQAFGTPDDPQFSDQWNLTKIRMPQAWDITTGSSEIVLAMIDEGVDWFHEDLAENLWQNLGEDADGDGRTVEWNGSSWVFDPGDLNSVDNDGNDKVDDLIGWDFANDNNDPEGHIHGTLTSGIAAARPLTTKALPELPAAGRTNAA